MTLAGVGFFAWLALIGLDAARFRWSRVPDWAQAFGAALLAGAMARGRTGSCATRCTRRSLLCRLSG
jgi:hypothetical protein